MTPASLDPRGPSEPGPWCCPKALEWLPTPRFPYSGCSCRQSLSIYRSSRDAVAGYLRHPAPDSPRTINLPRGCAPSARTVGTRLSPRGRADHLLSDGHPCVTSPRRAGGSGWEAPSPPGGAGGYAQGAGRPAGQLLSVHLVGNLEHVRVRWESDSAHPGAPRVLELPASGQELAEGHDGERGRGRAGRA